jgi:hypothetical protein
MSKQVAKKNKKLRSEPIKDSSSSQRQERVETLWAELSSGSTENTEELDSPASPKGLRKVYAEASKARPVNLKSAFLAEKDTSLVHAEALSETQQRSDIPSEDNLLNQESSNGVTSTEDRCLKETTSLEEKAKVSFKETGSRLVYGVSNLTG